MCVVFTALWATDSATNIDVNNIAKINYSRYIGDERPFEIFEMDNGIKGVAIQDNKTSRIAITMDMHGGNLI